MKILMFGDFHNRVGSPICRTDDFQETLENKTAEILKIAKKNHVTLMIQPGDFLDSPVMNSEALGALLERWGNTSVTQTALNQSRLDSEDKDAQKTFVSAIPLVGVVGNHELFGYSAKNYQKTALALLEKIGFMNLVTKEKPLILKDPEGFTIAITGSNYTADIDLDKTHEAYIVRKKLGDIHIHIVHGLGTDVDYGTLFAHTQLESFAHETQADLTIIGHDHIGFGVKKIDGKLFINPGAVTRLTASDKEINRTVKVDLLTIEKDGITVKEIPLKSALPAEQVISREHLDEKAELSQRVDTIRNVLESVQTKKKDSLVEIAKETVSSNEIPEAVRDDIMTRFNEKLAKDEKAEDTKTVEKYSFKKLHLVNFQSYEDADFEFVDGLNVLTGDNSSGKSAVFRAFVWILEDSFRNSRRLIREGQKFAEAELTLSNGTVILRHIDAKKSGENYYQITYPSGETEKMNTDGVKNVQDLMGFHYLELENGKEIPLNFLKQGTSWFFIGQDTTSTERAKMIGSIFDTYQADAIQHELEASIKKDQMLEKEAEDESKKLSLQADQFAYLPKMQNDIAHLEAVLNSIDSKTSALERLKAISGQYSAIVTSMENSSSFLEKTAEMAAGKDRTAVLLEHAETLRKAREIQTKTARIVSAGTNLKAGIARMDTLLPKKEKITELGSHVNLLAATKKAQAGSEKIQSRASAIESFEKKTDTVLKSGTDIAEIQKRIETLKTYRSMSTSVAQAVESGKQNRQKAAAIDKKLTDASAIYKNYLKEVGYCPVCHRPMDEHTIEEVAGHTAQTHLSAKQ
jgi:exonuclease SbcC